jgi:transposase InsO family protein
MELAKHIKPLAGETDWPIWKRKIRDLLDYHEGALDAIDGRLVKPEPLQVGAEGNVVKEHKMKSDFFRKANSYAKSMISSSVTDTVYQKIMNKDTAHEAWEALKLNFEASSKDQLFKICTEFFAFSWINGEDVSTHVAKLKNLWFELNNGLKAKNENALPDLILVCKVLQILPGDFENFRSSWMLLSKNEEKTFEELITQLCMYERNFRKTTESATGAAFLVKSEKKKSKKSKENDICNYCKKKGHWVKTCYKWIADGRPQKNAPQSNSLDTNIALYVISEDILQVETNSSGWRIDNGATKHVTNCPDLFIEFQEFQSPCVIKAAGQEALKAIGKGTIQIWSFTGSNSLKMTLNDVWLVPQISKNLFSVLAAQDRNDNSRFLSTVTECYLEVNGKTVLCGSRVKGGTLYKAAIEPVIPGKEERVSIAKTSNSTLQLYHERWGHQDKQHVRQMLKSELGIDVKLVRDICEPCVFGKAHRLPFGTRVKTTKPGELFSTDVVGPFCESFSKKRFLVVFKDSYTKFRYGFVMKQKSDVKVVLKQFLAHAKTLGHNIQELLSDNGGEFDCEEVKRILSENGILQRLTAPYTPEQNGGSERENRTIVEMARTFKYSNSEVEFPDAIWAELVTSAIYILNRTGKSSKDGVSPYELWMGKKPRIKHLRIIGSSCYVHIPAERRRKMDKKAVKGYLVGYDRDERYRIYIPNDNKVILSRDIQFQERINDCISKIKLPMKDIENEDQVEEGDRPDEQKIDTEGKSAINSEDSQKLRKASRGDEEYETRSELGDIDEEEETSQQTSGRVLRDRSTLKKPKHLEDYTMIVEEFVNQVTEDPATFEDALRSENSAEWKRAMDREITSLKENQTWILTDLPPGAKAIPCKWVFRLKKNPDGSIDKYKGRLVVKGFSQRHGIDYSETFSPVAKMGTIRSILSIAASEKMHLIQFDVSTAFLYGELEETVFMRQPQGYEDGTSKVCQLKRSLYGLKQAPRCWNKRFGDFLQRHGFKASDADPCLYIRERGGRKLILVIYVDDGLLAATDQREMEIFIEELKSEFKIVSKKADYFLGLEIEHEEKFIKIHQKTYAKKILERFNFSECKPVSTPILKGTEISTSEKDNQAQKFPYRQAVGALMYLMLGTRPDLAYSVGFISRTLENPTREDVIRVKRVFRYIAGTLDLGIVYRSNVDEGILDVYSDADFGGCTSTGRSTSGVIVRYAGGAISWMSQRQPVVATSTTEAEIIAANEGAKEAIWLSRLFRGIIQLKDVPIIQVDNSAAVRLAQNPEFHRRTKHISIKHFFIREKVTEGKLGVQQISTEHQVADIMTKPLPKTRLKILCVKMGLM